MWFECKICGEICDDGNPSDKICAMCILYSVDEGMIGSSSEQKCTRKPQEVNPAACRIQEA